MNVLSVKNISKSIKNNLIINDISFDIAKGQGDKGSKVSTNKGCYICKLRIPQIGFF